MKMFFLLFFIVASIFLLGQTKPMAVLPDEASVDGQAVVMPIGRVLLISRNDFIGAVKFLYNEKKKDGLYSTYEYFEYRNEAFGRIRGGVTSLKEAPRGFWHNIRRFIFHDIPSSFADKIKFNSFALYANATDEFHSTVCFWDGEAYPDLKVRLAPTPWKQIEEANLFDPRLRWFGYDKERERRVIPIDKIWSQL